MSDAALAKQIVALGRLSQLELDIRSTEDAVAVAYVAVNDMRRVVSYDHALMWLARERRVAAVSGGLRIDHEAPQIQWYRRCAAYLSRQPSGSELRSVEAATLPASLRRDADRWLHGGVHWLEVRGPAGWLAGGLFLQRQVPFNDAERRLLLRLAGAYGAAIAAHAGTRQRAPATAARTRLIAAIAVATVTAALAIPMRAVVLAEAKIVPAEPRIVAAPMDGVVQSVLVKSNETVALGQPLVRYDRTELAAAEQVAARRVGTLGADHARAEAQGFRDPKARAEIGVLVARLDEGEVELAQARNRLARSVIAAEAEGIALIDDPLVWKGRPVRVGERIMAIADPRFVRMEIALAPEDVAVVRDGAEVEFFLASAPATPIKARVSRIGHEARLSPSQVAVFVAEADIADAATPRLGLTGTAKIYGEPAAIAYLLLRKPLAAIRRFVGL